MLTPIQIEEIERAQVLAAANAHAGAMGIAVVSALLAALALALLVAGARQIRRARRAAACAKYLRRVA